MKRDYDPQEIEGKWQDHWQKSGIYNAEDFSSKPKFYSLMEFPYPSGDGLHTGHVRGYTAMDIVARKKRMEDFNVVFPIGWDAFGLPTENFAIKTGKDPRVVTKENTDNFRFQFKKLGMSFDWSREINTTDPKYYKWTQWIFLKFLEHDLAYKAKMTINWCPKDKIGLANEEVVDGKCERCGTPVEKREKEQWMLRITKYADKLLEALDATDYEMPVLIDYVNPHKPNVPEVKRNVAHAIVYDPLEKKYLIIRNKKFGWDTVVIGGIDEGESVEEAARREVREETGYVDLEFKRILGGPTESHYHTPHKGENRIAIAQAAYFELKSSRRVPIEESNLTSGEVSHNEILWVDEKDFVPGKLVNSELPIWLERLRVEVYFDKRNPGVPCFKDIRGSSAYQEGATTIEREAIAVIVKHWKDDSYIGLKWKKVDWQTIITGGVESGQTPVEAAIAEIREETGYQNIRFVKKLGCVDASFYHVPKGVNRYGHFHALYFELIDGEQKEITEEEKENHELVWVPKNEMSNFISVVAQKYIWNTLFVGENSHFIELSKPLVDYPERVKELQKNWIGKSEGAEISFKLQASSSQLTAIDVFTTRPDTIFGATYLVLAPEHHLIKNSELKIDNEEEVLEYIEKTRNKTDIERSSVNKEKTGVELKGIKAINPATKEEIPVWVADYVLPHYGTGAIMAVPADDDRDKEFAEKFNLPIVLDYKKASFEDFGKKITTYKLRDWVFSRQRYWGEPIPVVHCDKCGVVPVPEKDLPVELPIVENYQPTDTGESPLASIEAWVNTKCPSCGGEAKRETDTMPTWAGSSWYFLRYADPQNDQEFASKDLLKYWMPVDWYNGGMEHTTLHLLYSRFWNKFLFDIGLVPTSEPYKKRTSHGLIIAEGGEKMSKSKGNVINPDDIVKRFGADTLRLYEMFMGPFDQSIAWSESALVGPRRFIEKVWKLESKISPDIQIVSETLMHQTIKKVTDDIEKMSFNTAVSTMMVYVNELDKKDNISLEEYKNLLLLLAPFAPHVTEELWSSLGEENSLHTSPWPVFDPNKLLEENVTLVIQVDGKLRAKLNIKRGESEDNLKNLALSLPEVSKWLEGKEVKKVIYIEDRLMNLLTS